MDRGRPPTESASLRSPSPGQAALVAELETAEAAAMQLELDAAEAAASGSSTEGVKAQVEGGDRRDSELPPTQV